MEASPDDALLRRLDDAVLRRLDDAVLRRLDDAKRRDVRVGAFLGDAVAALFHRQIDRRHTQLGRAGEAWAAIVPDALQRHACVESLVRGRLTVLVDSAPHLFQLRQALSAGLEQQVLAAARGAGVRRVALKRGRWYDDDGVPCFK